MMKILKMEEALKKQEMMMANFGKYLEEESQDEELGRLNYSGLETDVEDEDQGKKH